jgi:CRISPR type IV-associated protein Csf3
MFYPLEITVYLKSPLLYQTRKPIFPLCLDSLLTWAAAIEKKGLRALSPAPEALEEIKLPLKQSGDKYRYYHASAMMLPTGQENPEPICVDNYSWVRSQSWVDYGGKYIEKARKKLVINKGRGHERAFSEENILVNASYVKFYAMGDPYEVGRLLGYITHLGSRRNIGGGKIYSVEISRAREDYGVIGPSEHPTRPVPVDEIKGSPLWFKTQATYKAPYWDVRETTLCYMPLPEQWCPTSMLPSRLLADPKKRYQIKKPATS